MNFFQNTQILELAKKANIIEIAEKLGLNISSRQDGSAKILCPFHDDHNPSLQLYKDSNKFHCFVCGAHGDIYDLIKKYKNCDFREALKWLANQYSFQLIPIASSHRNIHVHNSIQEGLTEAELTYKKQDKSDQDILNKWAINRNLPQDFLKQSGVYGAKRNKLSCNFSKKRETLENLINAGLVYRNKPKENKISSQKTFLKDSPYDIFSTDRIVFSLRNANGIIDGFAGRACSNFDKPKYLYSKGFSRAKTLYRFHEVRQRIRENNKTKKQSNNRIDLFVVEGLVDALRLEYLGLYAVAIFGTALTTNQIKLICDLSTEIEQKDQTLAIHLFFDSDAPGQQAMEKALINLLYEAGSKSNFLIDIICPNIAGKKDPDEIFRDADKINVNKEFTSWCFSPIEFLIARKLGINPSNTLHEIWSKQSSGDRFAIKRSIERNFSNYSILQNLVNRDILFINGFTGESRNEYIEELKNFFAVNRTTTVEKTTTYSYKQGYSNETSLLHALQVAQSSTQRREFPIDQGSWDRLQRTFGLVQFWMEEKLRNPQFGRSIQTEPMLAIKVPRPDKDFRNKALPCPEDLVLQQYMLNELLKEYESCPDFHLHIPAVRYSEKKLITTYGGSKLPTVSFAYQVDMDVLEGRMPPRNEGMYRGYYECWSSFIQYIDDRIMNCPCEQFHVARLDIRRYYDQLHRDAVYNVLFPALQTALTNVDNIENIAQIFDTGEKNNMTPESRASRIVDWFIDHSFEYAYYDPKNGNIKDSDYPNHGIPQGPDLSAYLANIALFPLDNIMREKINKLDEEIQKKYNGKKTYGGVYARYVDDIIIIVPSELQLHELKNTVSDNLARLGLELNQKTKPYPPMSKNEVVGWLTDRRGGLGVSGPFAGTLNTSPILHLDPLIDAGEIDRSDSLEILHNSTLDDPSLAINKIIESVKTAILADELRHGDYCMAAMRVWACVCYNQEEQINITELFLTYWHQCISSNVKKTEISLRHYLAALDGIERFLQRQPHRNPTLPEDSRKKGLQAKQKMAQYILENNLNELEKHVNKSEDEVENIENYRHMINLKKMSLVWQAKKVMSDEYSGTEIPTNFIPSKITDYLPLARHLFSLAEVFNNSTQVQNTRVQNIPILQFHFAVTLLNIFGHIKESDVNRDPLSSVIISKNNSEIDDLLNYVIRLWMTDDVSQNEENEKHEEEIVTQAIQVFIELVGYNNLYKLFQKYPRSKISYELLFGKDAEQNSNYQYTFIPVPTNINVPGIIGYSSPTSNASEKEQNKQSVFICKKDNSIPDENDFTPKNLTWEKGIENYGLCRYSASLNSRKLLPSKPPNDINKPEWIAKVFRALADKYEEELQQEKNCPPTIYNIIQDEKNSWNVLGFNVPVSNLTGQAFIRVGKYGLRAEPVPVVKDYLWRIGTAIADYLDLIDYSNSQPWIKLSLPKIDSEQWAEQSLIATALMRLRGKYVSDKSLKCDINSKLPCFIERVLTRLENFPVDNEIDKIAFRLAMIAEGRAFHYLDITPIDLSISGGPSAVLADIAVNTLYHDENISAFFAEYDETNTDISHNIPQRRAALAWFNLSKRFRWLAEQYSLSPKNTNSPDKSDPTIQCLQVAALLQAFLIEVRAKTLELWQLLTHEQKVEKTERSYHIVDLELDADLLLINDSGVNFKTEGAQTEFDQIRDLFLWFYKSTQDNTATSYNYLKRITPLGWTMLWGVLGNYIPNNILENINGITFKEIVSVIALSSDDDNDSSDLPWGIMLPIVERFDNDEFVNQLFGFLDDDDDKHELSILHKENASFTIQGLRGKEKNVTLENRGYSMPLWAIIEGRFLKERGYESVKESKIEKNEFGIQHHLFRWSETRYKGKLLSISVVGKGLASVSGLDKLDILENQLSYPEKQSDNLPQIDNTFITEKSQNDFLDVKENDDPKNVQEELVSNIENHENKIPLPVEYSFDQNKINELLAEQKKYWRYRSHKYQNHVRIALLQWKVDETYHHPLFDLFKEIDADKSISNLCKEEKKAAISIHETQFKPSHIEFRRQQIIKAVLEVCNAFNVDILLLPEYSVRPETLHFIWDTLQKQPQNKSNPNYSGTVVWAGTFRKPPDMTGIRINKSLWELISTKPTWSSILTIINPTKYSQPFFVRGKKYPSLAADEIFYPDIVSYYPLFICDKISTASQFIPWIYTLELICSESFLATSPSNLLSIAQSYDMLFRKFGVIDSSFKRAEDKIKNDLYQFALYTSLNSGKLFRRTILLLPAMSTRTQDYTLLGQSLYLSTGITTVFCNAVGDKGHGRSCFIGQDCWDIDAETRKEPIDRGPYHGVLPGIFRQNCDPRGFLGKEEQAMVIADIDPLYAIQGQPRQQVLPPSLSLVAHLPIIEDCDPENTEKKKELSPTFWMSFEKILKIRIKQKGIKNESNTAILEQMEVRNICNFLENLTSVVGTTSTICWMKERLEYFKKHHKSHPVMLPPPVAIDWIWVHTKPSEDDFIPEIEIPPYSCDYDSESVCAPQ